MPAHARRRVHRRPQAPARPGRAARRWRVHAPELTAWGRAARAVRARRRSERCGNAPLPARCVRAIAQLVQPRERVDRVAPARHDGCSATVQRAAGELAEHLQARPCASNADAAHKSNSHRPCIRRRARPDGDQVCPSRPCTCFLDEAKPQFMLRRRSGRRDGSPSADQPCAVRHADAAAHVHLPAAAPSKPRTAAAQAEQPRAGQAWQVRPRGMAASALQARLALGSPASSVARLASAYDSAARRGRRIRHGQPACCSGAWRHRRRPAALAQQQRREHAGAARAAWQRERKPHKARRRAKGQRHSSVSAADARHEAQAPPASRTAEFHQRGLAEAASSAPRTAQQRGKSGASFHSASSDTPRGTRRRSAHAATGWRHASSTEGYRDDAQARRSGATGPARVAARNVMLASRCSARRLASGEPTPLHVHFSRTRRCCQRSSLVAASAFASARHL